jgi:hypothetical protein
VEECYAPGYGYGYYAFNTEEDGIKKKFFEFIQADAEVWSYVGFADSISGVQESTPIRPSTESVRIRNPF